MDMDRRDQQAGRMEEIYEQLRSAYSQFRLTQNSGKAARINQDENSCKDVHTNHSEYQDSIADSEATLRPG